MTEQFHNLSIEAKKVVVFFSFLFMVMFFVLVFLFEMADKASQKDDDESEDY